MPFATTARGRTKLGGYFAKIGYCDLEVLAIESDFDDISAPSEVSVPNQERWEVEWVILIAPWQVRKTCLRTV